MSLVFLESSVDNSIHDESKIYLFPQKKKLHDPFVAHEFCSNTLPASSTNREWKTIDRWPSLVQLYSSTIFCAWDALCFCNVRRRHVTLRSPVPSNRVNKNKKLGKKIFFSQTNARRCCCCFGSFSASRSPKPFSLRLTTRRRSPSPPGRPLSSPVPVPFRSARTAASRTTRLFAPASRS